MCEQSIVEDAYQRLKENVLIKACCEVPMLGRFIDLAYIKGNSVVAIEFKLHNWRRAIRQSYDYRLGADFAYICMPKRKITQKMRNELLAAGVGLKFYLEDGNQQDEIYALTHSISFQSFLFLQYIRGFEYLRNVQ